VNVSFNTPFKVLAGDDDTVTEVKQQDCRFQLDIRQVHSRAFTAKGYRDAGAGVLEQPP
jgi:hypothetical protein